jgi:light-regulated signal transduction histidine kinase (bacteriophytochrome)
LQRVELEAIEARTAKEIAEARAELVEELKSKNEELESFSYSVAHDLRAPLRSIDGFGLALLEDYGEKLDDAGKEYLRYVRDSAQQMAGFERRPSGGRLSDPRLGLSAAGPRTSFGFTWARW